MVSGTFALGLLGLACSREGDGSKISSLNGAGDGGVKDPPGVVFGTGGAGGGGSVNGGASGSSGEGAGAASGSSGASSSSQDAGLGVSACGDSIVGLGECGAQALTAQVRHPHLLIVMDKSRSTIDQPPGFDVSIWEGMKSALAASLDLVKGRAWFGLELYPFSGDPSHPIPVDCKNQCCEMPANAEMNVPIEEGTTAVPKILAALEATEPSGGTPTAVALHRAYEYFTAGAGAALQGEKFVMLATDGGPNCNAGISCEASGCTTNLEGTCTSGGNCCANYGEACVDDQATITAIQELADAGIGTFVVGIPGSEAYSAYLDQFAITGTRTNPNAPPSYYRVDAAGGVAGLTSVFSEITTQLVTSCELELDTPPRDPDKVNVAVDCEVVPHSGTDGTDGWTLDTTSTPSTITLEGTLCRWVQQQGAERVDIVFGCQTVR